jgi:hypothetical protein
MDDYSMPAKIYMIYRPDAGGYARGGQIWDGTLAAAVRKVMQMTPDEQRRASIGTDDSLMRIDEISELYKRPDFPKQ